MLHSVYHGNLKNSNFFTLPMKTQYGVQSERMSWDEKGLNERFYDAASVGY